MYQAVYKCRLCGKKINQEIPEQAEIMVDGILGCGYKQEIYNHMDV